MSLREPALRMVQRYSSPTAGLILEVASRRPEFVLRFTTYRNIVVDERLLTESFQFVAPRSRLVAVAVVRGALEVDSGTETIRAGVGEAMLLGIPSMQRTRWENAAYLDLEWTPGEPAPPRPTKLRPPERGRVESVAVALADRRSDQRATLANAFDLFESIGAPVSLSVEALEGEPTDRDRRLALAIEEQLEHLSSSASTLHIGDSMHLSQRQVHRIVQEFNERYGVNAGNWRDTRNRWRLQIAAVLLGRPGATVAGVSKEVGYASPNALARAFAKVGFPAPAVVGRRMSAKGLP